MPDPKIERYEVIIPQEIAEDDYGNLLVQTTDDKEIKVNKKHIALHPTFRQAADEGKALKLGYAVYMNKEYVHTAEFFDGQPEPTIVKPAPVNVGRPVISITPQERGMWWKELGEMLRAGDIDLKTSIGKSFRFTYYTEMSRVLGIPIKEIPSSKLVEEVKKLGAVEAKPF